MSQGWIITHRKLRESSFYKDSQAVHLWIHLLISANHKDAQVVRGNKVYEVKRGQLITGRKLLSSETGINESKLQRLLKVFEKCHMIEQQTNSVNRLISIINYDQYQTSEQQVNSKRTASEQQVNTNNNDNNKNNDNNNKKPKAKKVYVLPSWINKETWADFEEMRKAKKKPMTDRARTTIINKLKGYGETKADQILEQSITHCWDTVYELKQDNTTQPEATKLHIL